MKQLFPLPCVSSRSVTNLRQTQKGFWAVRRGFVCFRQLCRSETWKVQLGLDPDETGTVQWCEGVFAYCSTDNRTSQTAGPYLLLHFNLIKFQVKLIVPESITILGCVTFRASPNKIILGWFCCAAKRTKPFFNYANKFMISFCLWFLLQVSVLFVLLIPTFVSSSTPTDIKSHYALLCQNSLDLVYYLYWQWVNSTVGWIPPCPGWNCSLSAAGREQASVMPLVYLKVRIVFVLTILTTYLPSWPAAPRGTYEEEANDSDWDISVCLLFFYVHAFFIWEEMKSLLESHTSKSTSGPNKGVQ